MTTAQLPPQPSAADPINRALAEAESALLAVADLDPMYLPADNKKQLMLTAARVRSEADAILAKGMASAPEVAEETGARDVASWLAHEAKLQPGPTHKALERGQALRTSWRKAEAAHHRGEITTDQVRIIADALDALDRSFKADTDILNATELLEKAEQLMLDEAPRLSLKGLKTCGERLMAYLLPDAAEEAERKRLEESEQRANAETRLNFKNRGDGSVDLHARIPQAEAHRLKTYLEAFTSPRTDALINGFIDPATGERLPADRLRGQAFIALLHAMDPTRMPIHGGDTTTVVVTVDFEALKSGLGTAVLGDGTKITAAHVRHLACQAHILPAVMGGKSEVLDLGRTRRLFSKAQRMAKTLAHKTCQAEGCDVPSTWCEMHHEHPWADGGKTDLNKSRLYCPHHHHRAHDPRYQTTDLPDGTTRFHRRT